MTPFVHLHVHSDYSPMEGVSSLTALCEAARAQGADTLALTDTNGLYGAIRFLEIAKETGLRPILGAELRTGQTPLPHDTRYLHPARPRAHQDELVSPVAQARRDAPLPGDTRYLHPARPRARQDELVSPVAQARTSVAAKSRQSGVGIDGRLFRGPCGPSAWVVAYPHGERHPSLFPKLQRLPHG